MILFLTGFILGGTLTTLYIVWFLKLLKKEGYMIIEPTQKLKDELK
jgi:hypothetical protein